MQRVAVLIVFVFLIGCDKSLPAPLQRVPPFDALEGLSLWMTADELRAARPRLRIAGYSGYADSIGGYSVGFAFPGSWSEDQAVPGDSHLRRIEASRRFPGDSLARAFYAEQVGRITSGFGPADACGRWVRTDSPGRVAYWGTEGTVIAVTMWGADKGAGGTVNIVWGTKSSYRFGGDSTKRPVLVRQDCSSP